MENKNSGNDFIIGLVLLLIVLIFAVNSTFLKVRDIPVQESINQENNIEYMQNLQEPLNENFIPDPGKLYWDHMPLTYTFRETGEFISTCQEHIKERLKNAFDIIKNQTNESVYFVEVNFTQENYDYDILVKCSNKVQTDGQAAQGISTAGEGGPTSIQGNKILKGELNLYPYRNCGTFPDVELHEIMHVLGFGHNESSRLNLMYPINLKCDGEFDKYLADELIEIYG